MSITPSRPAHRPARARARRLALALLGGVALTAGCDRRPESDAPYAEVVADIVPRLEAQMGMPFKTPPKIESRSSDEVRRFVMEQLTSERGRSLIAGQQSAYRVLGLIPDTLQLGGLLQRLLEEQIIGYYDPKTKVLYVVEGAAPALVNQTVAHELVHALQDQYVPLDSLQGLTADGDRASAAQAIIEGQAVFEGLRVDPNTSPMLKMPGGWDRIRDMIRDGQGGMPVFASAPRAVREGLLFPYLGGADFVRRFIEKRPTRELLSDLPVSTKQILNDRAYFVDDGARDLPTTVTLPAPRTGTVTFENTFGEFETRLMLAQHIRDEALVRRAAGGVDGDRYAVVSLPGGDGLVWASVWDTAVDAADFLDVATDAMRLRYGMGKQDFPAGATSRRLDAPAERSRGARTVTIQVEQVDGRPVVILTDVPAGAPAALIDPARITLAGNAPQ